MLSVYVSLQVINLTLTMILRIKTTFSQLVSYNSTFNISNIMAKTVISDLLQIFRSSVSAVLPEKLIKNTIKFNISTDHLIIAGENYSISNRNIYLVGTGKAVQAMANEVENILGPRIKQGIISIPVGSLNKNSTNKNVLYYEGAENNLPDANAEATALKVKSLISNLSSNDILLVLISGGGSALLPLPKKPVTLNEKSLLVKKLANAGADIMELNTVRKRISDLKGGQLAIKAQSADVISLILSDIVGDPLDLIASGPTTENLDHPEAAAKIIEKYNLYTHLSDSIKSVLKEKTSKVEEFPKNKVKNHIIGSNNISIREAKNEARNLNYLPIGLSNAVTGNVSDVANKYVELTKILCNYIEKCDREDLKEKLSSLTIPGLNIDFVNDDETISAIKSRDICLILGGEITVEVKGSGKGGRNQQLSLEFSKNINNIKQEFENFEVYFLSAGTDGIDGPTDAAGAIGYLDLISDAKLVNIDVDNYLLNNDSYNFYKEFKQGNLHVITGHTNTNVMDIHLIIIKKRNKSLL